ncbi:hypothetical protein SAMN05892883_4102 [Jatrophihabitans sp. GAS493]|uniref:hypothetical protein n=1 Tax=Jatrophihabitans sp. GAS493 TaxID=1907575 RepID=UPI000BB6AD7D|nr:hypothetical protein [Jatrophihabitans sp. GAS493]SOD74908.1 hypothetical protein SAMN05892883_4102 [Jatrophihabitans sp. GAS493]
MTTAEAGAPAPEVSDSSNRWLYWVVGIVVVILAVIGLVAFNGAKTDQEAKDKAHTLSQKLSSAGLTSPDEEVLVRTFGTDGGAVCDNPANSLGKATLFSLLSNGASFVGQRPVIVDRRVLQGEALILQTYCPEKLDKYQDTIDKLKTADVIRQK